MAPLYVCDIRIRLRLNFLGLLFNSIVQLPPQVEKRISVYNACRIINFPFSLHFASFAFITRTAHSLYSTGGTMSVAALTLT